jgi:hypothetical protein
MITKHIRTFTTNFLLSSVLVFTSIFAPIAAAADTTDPTTPPPCTAPQSSSPGVHVPTGSDSGTYHYNCDLKLWANNYYTYDPVTTITAPIDPITYTCNAATTQYDYNVWLYNVRDASYVLTPQTVATPPAGSPVIACPTPYSASISNTGANSNNSTDLGGSINNTGANSDNTIGSGGTTGTTINDKTGATINNTITGIAGSGSAAVLSNTNAGGANTGDANDIANVVNLLQSQSNAFGQGDVTTFTADINGDVNGDFLLDPALLSTVQPTAGSPNLSNNLDVNNSVDASINNNITLNAASGNAAVDSNTNAGDATSGNANAVANIINLINSALVSGKSFIGTININGNLNGDILLPPDFIDQLIAANIPTATIDTTGKGSTNTINEDPQGTNTKLTNTNNAGITNNINAGATSGTATSSENTNAGGATSGDARTHITAFNLTGSQIIGRNAILVFVNVMGTWVGMIVNAPAGATSAAIGGGLTTNRPGYNTNDITNDTDASITNNINVNARSGDAGVTRNTNAGSAKTGNARADVNLANIQNSSLSLSGWFGWLIINVRGSWNGSFGINTSAGDPPRTGKTIPTPGNSTFGDSGIVNAAQLVSFVSRPSTAAANTTANPTSPTAVLAAKITKQNNLQAPTPTLAQSQRSYLLPVATIVLFVTAILLEQIASRRTL